MTTVTEYTATLKALTFHMYKTLETGTTEKTCTTTSHGLETGDFIINITRRATSQLLAERGSRKITVIDNDNFTVSPDITNQAINDTIATFKWFDSTNFLIDGTLTLNLQAEGKNEAKFVIKSKTNG